MAPKSSGRGLDGNLPFESAFFTDLSGRILCVMGGDLALREHPPAQLAALGSLVSADGLLPPRAFSRRDVIGGQLLSVAGERALVHAFYSSEPSPEQPALGLRAVLDFESAYGAHLGATRVDRTVFSAAPARVSRAFAGSPGPSNMWPSPPGAFVHAVLEPRGPGILVGLRVRNFTREVVRGVSITFASPKDFLRPAALFGTGAAVDTSAVHLLEGLEPGEKTLELRLEPQEPRTGPFELTLRTPGGREAPARPLHIAVVLPKLEPPISNPSLLARELEVRESDARDIWRMRFTRAVTPAFAFERAKEAVAREGALKLMEFSAPSPAYHEAWYLARVLPSGRRLLVEVAVRGPGRLIEFRAATAALGDLLGIKAEYRRRVRELLSERFMGRRAVAQRSDALAPTVEDVPPHLHSSLLLRHLQGELGAEELWGELRATATGGSGEGWQFVAPLADKLGPFEEGEGGGRPRPPRPPRAAGLVGVSAEGEGLGGLLDGYTRLLAPIVLAQTARMVRTGARLRTGLDRGAEAEAEAADGDD